MNNFGHEEGGISINLRVKYVFCSLT